MKNQVKIRNTKMISVLSNSLKFGLGFRYLNSR